MHATINQATLELKLGDIVKEDVDAIVNAANVDLRAGGGVCGAIFEAAGREQLAAACKPLAPCATGEARMTPGFCLQARHIIHAVGPIYNRYKDQPARAAELLASAYHCSLTLAAQYGLSSVAFPSISTGVYGYPLLDAASIALCNVADALQSTGSVRLVRFVLWDQQPSDLDAYVAAAKNCGLVLVDD